jgi:hypothetical protein
VTASGASRHLRISRTAVPTISSRERFVEPDAGVAVMPPATAAYSSADVVASSTDGETDSIERTFDGPTWRTMTTS